MAQPAEHTIAQLPGTCAATVDAATWWKINIPADTSRIVFSSAMTLSNQSFYYSFDTSIAHGDAVASSFVNDGTIYTTGAVTFDESGEHSFTINLKPNGPARGPTAAIPFYVGALTADSAISVTVT